MKTPRDPGNGRVCGRVTWEAWEASIHDHNERNPDHLRVLQGDDAFRRVP